MLSRRSRPLSASVGATAAIPLSLADETVAAAITAAEAADRAEQAMTVPEARTDEAITAYRAADDAWRALPEGREADV